MYIKPKKKTARKKAMSLATRKQYATRIAASAGGGALLVLAVMMFRRSKTLIALLCLLLSIGNLCIALEGLFQLHAVLSVLYMVISVIYNTLETFFSKRKWYKIF